MFLKPTQSHVVHILVIAALVIVAVPSLAQDHPFYVEANVGGAYIDDVDGISIDESTTAFRFGTGYRFSSWIGISGSYVDLGSFASTVDFGTGTPQQFEASADGFELTLTGRIPLSDAFALTADLGVLWWTGDTNIGGVSDSDSGNDATWGVGAEYAFGPTFMITADYRRFKLDNVDVDAAWLGAMIRFGDAKN